MSEGFICRRGGGGGGLNFEVKAYAAAADLPYTAKENTIAVITDAAIAGWIFSAAEPEGPVAGMVWFEVGTESEVAFNLLKKNAVYVYPMSCKQYVGGAWTNVEAYVYKGEWVQFSSVAPPYFYKDGESSVELLGNGTNSGGYITLTSTDNLKQPEAYFVIPDIEKYSTISCVISSYSGFTPIVYIRQISTGTNVATAKPSAQGETVSVDLSGLGLSGNDYYFVLHTEAVWTSTGSTNGYWSHATVKTNYIWGA